MVIDSGDLIDITYQAPRHLQSPTQGPYGESKTDSNLLEDCANMIVVSCCVPTNREIEDIYKENARLARDTKTNLLGKVLREENIGQNSDSIGRCPFLCTGVDHPPKGVVDNIKAIIREEYEKEVILIQALKRRYERLYYEWIDKKDRCYKSKLKKNSSKESPVIKPAQFNGNLGALNAIAEAPVSKEDRRLQNLGFRRGIASDTVKTEAEFQAVLELLSGNNQELTSNDDRLATEPDLVINPNELDILRYVDFNCYIPDFSKDFDKYDEKMFFTWTDEEREAFYRHFLIYGKDFYKIASYLPNKTVNACVHYYYREKIRLGLSRIVRKSLKQRRRILRKRMFPNRLASSCSQAVECYRT